MGENRFSGVNSSTCRETVSIETNRILDSCKDRDCYENVKVLLTEYGYDIVDHTSAVRTKSACISAAHITIDPVQFNRGFYTVNIRFYIKLCFEACTGCGKSQEFDGVAVVEKKVILYGSESNVRIFKSSTDAVDFCSCPDPVGCSKNIPRAVVEVVDPIVLCTRVMERNNNDCCCCCCASDVPESVTDDFNGLLRDVDNGIERFLTVSLGIFSVIRMVRPAQYIINATEYNVPDKECIAGCENDPCGIFRNMAFPTSEFNPPTLITGNIDKHCGC